MQERNYIENFAVNSDDNNYSVTFAANSFGIVLGKDDDGVSFDAVDGKVYGTDESAQPLPPT